MIILQNGSEKHKDVTNTLINTSEQKVSKLI